MSFFTAKTAPGAANPTNQFQVLVDSDAFIGWLVAADAHHQIAAAIFQTLQDRQILLTASNLVIAETATVLSYRHGQSLATKFLATIRDSHFPIIHIDEALHQAALEIFRQQPHRGTSVTDCANVAVMHRFNIPAIFSFDQFYAKQFGLATATEVYDEAMQV